MKIGTRIIGTGCAFPKTAMKNEEFEAFIETSDEWIRTRTGIKERRIADREKGETTLSISKEACLSAIEKSGIKANEIDLVIVGTVTPENIMPTTANQLQSFLGTRKGFAFDIQAACSGFLYGLSIADQYIRNEAISTALVVGAETLSTIVNWKDRTTCVLFGDGAGAAVVQKTDGPHRVIETRVLSDGDLGPLLTVPHGYAAVPPYAAEYRADMHTIQMQGREVFKQAVRSMVGTSKKLLKDNNVALEDIDFFIFHQANLRIIDTCMKMLDVPKEKTWINLDKYGNTSAATLPSCLDEAWRAGAVKEGDLILMTTFGGGLTWASSLVRL